LANRLSADPSIRVALLEAGGDDKNPLIKMPIGFTRLMYDEKVTNIYKTEPEPELNGREMSAPRGRVLGGCSSIAVADRASDLILGKPVLQPEA
jgi:choline dehydrogenase